VYYHCRPLKYVEYGKVIPPPIETLEWMVPVYRWVGNYCGYFPQIWLSRSSSLITGYRNKGNKDCVLFGFDIIKGFPLSYRHWEMVMSAIINEDDFKDQNKSIERMFNGIVQDYKDDKEEPEGEFSDWVSAGCNLETFLKDYLFKEVDQVVVPSLNLKSAKEIICHNEKQKKKLLKMGFIEDRIHIKNLKKSDW